MNRKFGLNFIILTVISKHDDREMRESGGATTSREIKLRKEWRFHRKYLEVARARWNRSSIREGDVENAESKKKKKKSVSVEKEEVVAAAEEEEEA